MTISQRLDLRQQQSLVMTPQLQLAIKLLQMNALDLQTFIAAELMENPFLSDGTEGEEQAAAPVSDEMPADTLSGMAEGDTSHTDGLDVDWDTMYDSPAQQGSGAAHDGDDVTSWENNVTTEKTLRSHLEEQLGVACKHPKERFLGMLIIDAINDSGYLQMDVAQTAKQLGLPEAELERVLKIVQSFDPVGVGARNLAECLRIQLEARKQLTPATLVVLDNLDLLARQDFVKLARITELEVERIQMICDNIKSLTPKPGLQYGRAVANEIVPEVIITKDAQGEWKVELNAEAMPKVLLNKQYSNTNLKGSDKNFQNDKVARANWLLKSLEQRAKTIFRTAKAIVELQSDFFNHGVEGLKPMTLKVVADRIEMHESTISRVTTGKYMQTPLGVFEFKYFFSSAINTTGGSVEVASESVKHMIKKLVATEDARKPLSDEKIVALLKNEGVDIARRTVAKYREALGILPTSQRRIRV